MIRNEDHVGEALSRLPARLRRRERFVALLSIFVSQVQELEDAIWGVLTKLSIDDGEGVILDMIGRVVKQPRPSAADEEYRRHLRAALATFRSKGRIEDLITILKLLFEDDESVSIEIENQRIATVRVKVSSDDGVSAIFADAIISFLRRAVSGGVRLILESSIVPSSETFTLAAGPGLGFGTAAFLTVSTTGTLLRARAVGVVGNSLSLRLVGDAGAPSAGDLTNVGDDWTFSFLSGVTTIADFEAAVDAIDEFVVREPSGIPSQTLDSPVDEIVKTNFSGGVDGGRLAGTRT